MGKECRHFFYWFLLQYVADLKKNVVFMSTTYVDSTSDIIATPPPSPACNDSIVQYYYHFQQSQTTNRQPMTSSCRRKNDEISLRHRRLFFRPDKVSCLIVVFSALAALTPRRPSSVYPSAEEKMVWSCRGGQRWRPSAAARRTKVCPRARYCTCAFKFVLITPDLSPGTQEHGCGITASGPRPRILAAAAGITAPGCGHEVEKGVSPRTHFLNLI